ncbi:YbeF family transcriptional regulator [Entomohabitans teleogrylli]|uniref:YbeF family transcriptional regulator n=1 Tax=Entomohabitans teleogrylli TaxID=1384589 RepID=UPI00073D2124|nr:YbeF family transcriptional regulator [Entomohabitans teleogrylli]
MSDNEDKTPPAADDEVNNFPTFKMLRNIDLNLLTIFEAVYVHKGIVNAARVLNLTPSAISQSMQKLRAIFPDPLFIRHGQGVKPTAYATQLHEHISRGFESILNALDFYNANQKHRTITIATSPTVGAMLIPRIFQAMKKINRHLSIRHIPITDAETQLTQFQTDLLIDHNHHYSRSIGTHFLFEDRPVAVCRVDHPLSDAPPVSGQFSQYEQAVFTVQADFMREIRREIEIHAPGRIIALSSYNVMTIAAVLSITDIIGFMTEGFYHMYRDLYGLRILNCGLFRDTRIQTNLHFNKLSQRDPLLQQVIDAIHREFTAPASRVARE